MLLINVYEKLMKVINTISSSPVLFLRHGIKHTYITNVSLSVYINIVHESEKNTKNYSPISDVFFLRLT